MSNELSDASRWLEDKLSAIEAPLAEAVAINSFTDNVDGGREVAKHLRDWFAIDGVRAETVASARYADHLIFATEGRAGVAPVALVGHLDTVFPPGKFEGFRRDGALWRGPGVLDMKGGLAVVAWAMRAIAATRGLASIAPLRVVVVSDEEVGSPEGQGVIQRAIAGSSACLVFESGRTNDAIVTRRKGTGGMTITALGKAAHAGNNHADGVNAIWVVAKVIDRVQALTDYARGISVNVGKVSGGQGKNTVPDRCEVLLDLRFETVADASWLVDRVRAIAQESGAAVTGARVEIDGGVLRQPMEKTPASEALMRAYGECAKAFGLGAGEAALVGGGSDASTSSAMGIASIDGLGPRGKGFHTVDEQIDFATLVPRAQALAEWLVRASSSST